MTLSFHDPLKFSSPVVNDKIAIIYLLWIGGNCCIAWNGVTNCFDFFIAKFPTYNVTFVFPIAPYVAQLLSTLLITELSNRFSYNARVVVSSLLLIAATIIIPFEADLFADSMTGMCIMMAILFVVGFCNALGYASVGGFTSKIDGKYTAYMLIGVAVFGLLMNLIREATLLIFNPESNEQMNLILVYFGITAIFLIIGVIIHTMFIKSEFYKVHALAMDNAEGTNKDSEVTLVERSVTANRPQRNLQSLLVVLKDTKWYMLLLMLTCMQQSLMYPGVMLKKPMLGISSDTKTVTLIMTFSVFFIVGKTMGKFRKCYNDGIVIVVVLFRFVLMGFFVIQAVTMSIPVFNSIWFGYFNVALYAITLGFLNVALFILAPEKVEGEKKEVAGFLGVFGINCGTMIGAFLSLALTNMGYSDSS